MKWTAASKWATLALVICILAGVGVLLARQLAEQKQAARIQTEVDQLVALVVLPNKHQERFDAVRAFLNEHSIHKINQEFRALSGERAFTTAILAHATGKREQAVPMECSTRSNLMGKMLRKLGYKTRTVATFDKETARSHTFLDVLNPDSGEWESQDPDYNIYWRDPLTKERASVAERSAEVAVLEPCRAECGWEVLPKAKRLLVYFDSVVVKDKKPSS